MARREISDPDDEAAVANRGSETWAAYAEAWRNGGLSAMRQFLHPDFRFDSASFRRAPDRVL
jgi:hypothetical protein